MARNIEKSSEISHRALNFKEAIANLAYKLSGGISTALIAIVEFKSLIDSVTDNDLKSKILDLRIEIRNEIVTLNDVLSIMNKDICVKKLAQQTTKILNENIANQILESNLNSVSQNERNPCLILFTIVQNVEEGLKGIKKYLLPLSQEELLNVIKERNHDQNSLLHIAARDSNDNRRLLAILTLIYPRHRAEVALEQNCNGDPLIHLLADKNDKFASLKEFLSLVPPEDRLQAINAKDRLNGNPILHNLATLRDSPEGIVITLESLPTEMRLEAIRTKNDDGYSLVDILVKNSNEKILQAVSDLVPEAKTEIEELMQRKKMNASEYSASFINTMGKTNNASEENLSKNNPDKTATADSESKKRWVMPQRRKF